MVLGHAVKMGLLVSNPANPCSCAGQPGQPCNNYTDISGVFNFFSQNASICEWDAFISGASDACTPNLYLSLEPTAGLSATLFPFPMATDQGYDWSGAPCYLKIFADSVFLVQFSGNLTLVGAYWTFDLGTNNLFTGSISPGATIDLEALVDTSRTANTINPSSGYPTVVGRFGTL
jgi:hypothetical protein